MKRLRYNERNGHQGMRIAERSVLNGGDVVGRITPKTFHHVHRAIFSNVNYTEIDGVGMQMASVIFDMIQGISVGQRPVWPGLE